MANYENESLRLALRKLPCQNCGNDDGTIVAAHSNQYEHGKGKGLKAHDCFVAALCHRCHLWLDNQGGFGKDPAGVFDNTRADKITMFNKAMHKTWLVLWQAGVILVGR